MSICVYKPKYTSWTIRPNQEERINRKPKDRINDRRTEQNENRRTEYVAGVDCTELVKPGRWRARQLQEENRRSSVYVVKSIGSFLKVIIYFLTFKFAK